VVDATGTGKTRELAGAHLRGPIRKVVVSANARGMDLTVCMGVNDDAYDPARHHLLSAASCTTNCLVPVVWLLDRAYGIEAGLLDTVHSYNNDQSLLDAPHDDPRRARAAALNMIPTTTSAIEAAIRILPHLEGRLAGLAVRVPTPNVSLIDLAVTLSREASAGEIAELFRSAERGELAGILATTDEELVSSDFLRRTESAIVDLPLLQQAGDRLHRIVAWYDNEWGHASRLADLVELTGRAGLGSA
jgi:glyceraldehyde 3-phosphate dehydrogenase